MGHDYQPSGRELKFQDNNREQKIQTFTLKPTQKKTSLHLEINVIKL